MPRRSMSMPSTTAADMIRDAEQRVEHLPVAQVAAEVARGDVVLVDVHAREERRARSGQHLWRDAADRDWTLCTTSPISRLFPAQMR
jgi:hypothetical protein